MIPRYPRFPQALLFVYLFALMCPAQEKKTPGDAADALVKWDSTCGARGCLMQADVLRGVSDNPPDPKDFREYVSLNVALDRSLSRPAYFSFLVDPRAQADHGIFITFAKTTQQNGQWKVNLDPEGPSRLAIGDCDKNSCSARVPLGLVEDGKDAHKMDLLDKFQNSDHLLVLYTRDGHAYRTMVGLSSFQKEYARVMENEMKSRAAK
jgi:hypothetical protein